MPEYDNRVPKPCTLSSTFADTLGPSSSQRARRETSGPFTLLTFERMRWPSPQFRAVPDATHPAGWMSHLQKDKRERARSL
jgi:hypothetical protein